MRLALLALPLAAILGCASTSQPTSTTATPTANPICLVWRDISYSANADSAVTVREIISNNAARDAACAK